MQHNKLVQSSHSVSVVFVFFTVDSSVLKGLEKGLENCLEKVQLYTLSQTLSKPE